MSASEQAFRDFIVAQGWTPTRGLPDFCCFRDNEVILVEVKSKKTEALRPHQLKVARALSEKGIHCFRWSPDNQELTPSNKVPQSPISPLPHIPDGKVIQDKVGFLGIAETSHLLGISKNILNYWRTRQYITTYQVKSPYGFYYPCLDKDEVLRVVKERQQHQLSRKPKGDGGG